MSQNTSIEWADHTWVPIAGCDAVSPACANCYAATMAARLEAMGVQKYAGLATRHGALGKWTGKITVSEADIMKPLSVKKPGSWFLTSMGDVGHEKVSDEVLDRLFAVMILADWHEFYVLTKRPDRIRAYLSDPMTNSRIATALSKIIKVGQDIRHIRLHFSTIVGDSGFRLSPLHRDHIFIGCTAEDQPRADERRPHMKAIADMGWRTMVSYEPALKLVNWAGWEFLSWLISGGESGNNARPTHPDWHRGARDFCATNGIPFLFKQWGEWLPGQNDAYPDWDGRRVAHHQDGSWGTLGVSDYERKYVTWDSDGQMCFGEVKSPLGNVIAWSRRVGKKAAGRLLDGVEHSEFPKVPR